MTTACVDTACPLISRIWRHDHRKLPSHSPAPHNTLCSQSLCLHMASCCSPTLLRALARRNPRHELSIPSSLLQVLDFSDAVDGGTTTPSLSARRTGPHVNQRLWGSADSLSSGDAAAAAAAAASDEEQAAEAGSGNCHSWEPSPFTWDNIPVAAPTPGYRLVERSPEGHAKPQPDAAPPAEQPPEQSHREPQQQPRGDPQQQLPQQRRSTRVALDTLGESLAEQPTLPPAAAASQDRSPAAAPATSDVLPIPAHSAAGPALRSVPS